MTQGIADMSTTVQGLTTYSTTGWKITSFTAPHLYKICADSYHYNMHNVDDYKHQSMQTFTHTNNTSLYVIVTRP